MNLIEIDDNEYINIDKCFAFELCTHGKSEEDAYITLANSVIPITLDYKSGLALRDYLISSPGGRPWVYIRQGSREIILNQEQISRIELADSFWYVAAGEHVSLQNCSEQCLPFDENQLLVMPDCVHIKPSSFMKLKSKLSPVEILVTIDSE